MKDLEGQVCRDVTGADSELAYVNTGDQGGVLERPEQTTVLSWKTKE